MKNIIILVFIMLSLLCFGQQKWEYTSLNSFSELDSNFNDFKSLDSIFSKVQLVGAGESTHGSHEFTTMRHRLFRYLVENHHYNTFFLEADYGACMRVNRYIHGNNDTLKQALHEIKLWPWMTEEMMGLIEWMKYYNSNHIDKIEFIGCDMQLISDDYLALNRMLNDNHLVIPDFITNLSFEKKLRTDSLYFEETKSLWQNYLSTFDSNSLSERSKKEFKFLSNSINQWFEFELITSRNNNRDSCMASNINCYLKENQNNKGLFFAHNGHIAKTHNEIKNSFAFNRAGYFLDQLLKSNYFAIGFETDQGKFNAVGYPEKNMKFGKYIQFELESSSRKAIAFQLNKLNNHLIFIYTDQFQKKQEYWLTSIGAVYGSNVPNYPKREVFRYRKYNLKNDFDAIIFIKQTTPTNLIHW
ncbi:MAG: erythromycin esterase family protein [Flavobacteriia bacterium]|nr:erythromycin esterase family protein [Flavobacteriia bacterium]